jgi:transcriptional regulator with XRE-family HTH domain
MCPVRSARAAGLRPTFKRARLLMPKLGKPTLEPRAKTFGARIRQLRKAKGLTQRDLAERVEASLKGPNKRGFKFPYLSKIENEEFGPPSEAAIVQLAAVLEANSDELFSLAGKLPVRMADKLARNRAARAFFNFAIDRLSETEWQQLLVIVQQGRTRPS